MRAFCAAVSGVKGGSGGRGDMASSVGGCNLGADGAILIDVVQPGRSPSRDDRRAVSRDAKRPVNLATRAAVIYSSGARLNALAIASRGISSISAVGADQPLDALAIRLYTVSGAVGAEHWLSELVVFCQKVCSG